MSLLLTKFIYVDSNAVSTVVTDAETISINLGSELTNNRLEITLQNPPLTLFSDKTIKTTWVGPDGTTLFNVVKATAGDIIDEELIEVYAYRTDKDPYLDVATDGFLLMTGVIDEGELESSPSGTHLKLKCVDRNKIILDKLTIPQAFKIDLNFKSPTIIQKLIRNASDNVPSNSRGFLTNGIPTYGGDFLIDARLFSEGVKTSGTATSTTARELNHTGGNFITNGVEIGDWVRNNTTFEYAYVQEVVSENQLILDTVLFTTGATYEISNGFIQDKRIDGTDFPSISYSQINQQIRKSISELSSTVYTNTLVERTDGLVMTRNMRFFVDRRNRFHWYLPGNSPQWIFNTGTTQAVSPDTKGHTIEKITLKNSVKDNVNFIIFYAGLDMNGKQIKSWARAPFSGSPNAKESKRLYENIARAMKKEDAVNLTYLSEDNWDYPSSYPMTPLWDSEERAVANNSTYNTNFKEEAIKRGKGEALAEFAKAANPRWEGTIMIEGEAILPGDLIRFTDNESGIKNILVRVTQVNHILSENNGWSTSLNVEEDEVEYTQGI
jgi:hypothetical protein